MTFISLLCWYCSFSWEFLSLCYLLLRIRASQKNDGKHIYIPSIRNIKLLQVFSLLYLSSFSTAPFKNQHLALPLYNMEYVIFLMTSEQSDLVKGKVLTYLWKNSLNLPVLLFFFFFFAAYRSIFYCFFSYYIISLQRSLG